MRYIIITTPFSGANHIAENLFNLMKQWYGCRKFLHSFLNVKHKEDVVYLDGTIYYEYQYNFENTKWFQFKRILHDSIDKKIQFLLNSPNHLITLHIDKNLQVEIKHLPILFNDLGYTPIFIERKNKLHQILAYVNFSVTHQSDRIPYFSEMFKTLIDKLKEFKDLKKTINGKTIYYEDFVALGADENALIQLLNLDNKPFTPANIENRFFEFTEDNIIPGKKWREDREEILALIAEIG